MLLIRIIKLGGVAHKQIVLEEDGSEFVKQGFA